jgi:D-alanyl-D-alanine carboxypeptidase
MKKIFLTMISMFVIIFLVNAQQSNAAIGQKADEASINKNYSKAAALQSLMKKYTEQGLPGISMAVFTEGEGWWAGAAGYSKVETKTPLTNDHLMYLQSVAKSYMAVVIMKLHEEKKIDLNAPVSKYLPAKQAQYLKSLDKITIKMLLNHTSGVPEYSENPEFISYVLLHPTLVFNMDKALEFISKEELQFVPGSKHKYTNTNFLILAMIADAITGDHAVYMDKVIFQRLGLKNTFYRSSPGYLHYSNLVDSYWDVLNTGRAANITPLQRANVATLKGDDGIVCTTTDAVKFLKGLVEGKLLNDSSLALMKEWVNDNEGHPIYGLGLVYYAQAGLTGFGHSGGGIGAGCILIYVPQKKTYIFLATNVATLFGGDLAKKADDMKNEALGTILF